MMTVHARLRLMYDLMRDLLIATHDYPDDIILGDVQAAFGLWANGRVVTHEQSLAGYADMISSIDMTIMGHINPENENHSPLATHILGLIKDLQEALGLTRDASPWALQDALRKDLPSRTLGS